MSKKPKQEVEADHVEDPVIITAKTLNSLLRADTDIRDDIGELTDGLREKVAYAVLKHHLDKDAYQLIKKFKKWHPAKLAAVWPTLLIYMDMTGLMKEIEAQGELPMEVEGKGDPEEKAETPAEPAENVSRPRFGAKAAAVAE
jgi:hypothetical protein